MVAPSTPTESPKPPIPPALTAWGKKAGKALGMPLGSVVVSFVLGAVIVLITGGNPVTAYQGLLCGGVGVFCSGDNFGGFTTASQISQMLLFLTPLMLAGLSVAIAFRAGLFNIGAEGQLIVGAIATTWAGIHFKSLPGALLVPLVLLAGMVAGALWGGIVGVLKALTGAHEVVTTIMLNYIAQLLLLYLIVNGPMQQKNAFSRSGPISNHAKLPTFTLPGSSYPVHYGLFVALGAVIVFAFLMRRTALGYEIRAVGQSQRAARFAGVSVKRTIIVTMLIAGAFAGLAGAVQIAGLRFQLTDSYQPDTTGFDAIAVSLLGANAGIGIVLSGVLFAALDAARTPLQLGANISSHLTDILQALILFCIAANFLRFVKLRVPSLSKRPASDAAAEPGVAAVATDIDPGARVDAGMGAGLPGE